MAEVSLIGSTRKSPSIIKIEVVLFMILWLTFAYFYQGGFANSASRLDMALALVYDHSLAIDSFHLNTIDKAFFDGHFYSEKAPGSAILTLPVTWVFSWFFDKYQILNTPVVGDFYQYLVTVLVLGSLSAFSAVCFRRILSLLNPEMPLRDQVFLTIATWLGTLIFSYSVAYFGHQIAGALVVVALYFGLSVRHLEKIAFKHVICAFLLAYAVFCEYPVAVLAVGSGVSLLLISQRFTPWLKALPVIMIPGCMLLVYNGIAFGNPFSLGYGHLEKTIFNQGMSSGFYGVSLPSFHALMQLLFGVYRGLFVYSPVLLLAIIGWFYVPRKLFKRFYMPLLCSCLLLILINSSYSFWQGGVCFGPRHLVPIIPILAFGFAFLPRSQVRNYFSRGVFAISLLINFAPVVTTLYVSEYEVNPLWRSYLPMLLEGEFSNNPLHFTADFEQSSYLWTILHQFPWASFNLGEIMGLRGYWSLAPLLLLWLAAGYFLRNTSHV